MKQREKLIIGAIVVVAVYFAYRAMQADKVNPSTPNKMPTITTFNGAQITLSEAMTTPMITDEGFKTGLMGPAIFTKA